MCPRLKSRQRTKLQALSGSKRHRISAAKGRASACLHNAVGSLARVLRLLDLHSTFEKAGSREGLLSLIYAATPCLLSSHHTVLTTGFSQGNVHIIHQTNDQAAVPSRPGTAELLQLSNASAAARSGGRSLLHQKYPDACLSLDESSATPSRGETSDKRH